LGIELLVALMFSQFFVQILKRTLGRQRPYKVLNDLNTFGIEMKDYSFPSGHTTASFCVAVVISINYPQMLPFTFLFAVLIGISRIYLGVHFPSDVLAGAVLGIASAFIVHYYFQWAVHMLNNLFTVFKL
jgi:undecaprenyl-diphosphatase